MKKFFAKHEKAVVVFLLLLPFILAILKVIISRLLLD